MRAFVAIPLPAPLRAELAAYAVAASGMLGARATPEANLHATVHFLGAVRDGDAAGLEAALTRTCGGVAAFTIAVGEAALAPSRRPRMLWARIAAPAELAALARAAATAAGPFAPDARAPRTESPHVTLARLRRPPPRDFTLAPLPAAGIELRVEACELVRSEIGPGGSRYTTLAVLPLG